MLNLKIISKVLGLLLFIEAFFLFVSLLVALYYGGDDVRSFLVTTVLTVLAGVVFVLLGRKAKDTIGKREAYIIVSLVWVVFSLFGALPFVISGYIPDYTDAFFETISGFTTTGASILNDIERLPKGLLFWRSLTQWLGGMGIIVLSLALLPVFGIGGMQLFAAEVPGPTADKIHPRVGETAKRLWGIYILYTVAETVLLVIGGMSFYDAVNHSFTTMATGGYSTKQASIAYWSSPFIQYVIIVFMFLAGTNFSVSYLALKGQFKKVWKNEEFRYYLGFTVIFSVAIMFMLLGTEEIGFEKAFRDSLFQVVSIMTTTGFATADYWQWAHHIGVFIFMIMFFGGSAGSTGGGIKTARIVVLFKNLYIEFKRLIHPNAVIPVRLNDRVVEPAVVRNILAFVLFFIILFFAGSLIMTFMGLDLVSAMGAVIACLGNIGPGIGSVGPAENYSHIPAAGKWLLSFYMLIGRLELFTVLILFTPAFWRK